MADKISIKEAREAWRIVKEYALGDRQPFVVSDQIANLDKFFSEPIWAEVKRKTRRT